MKARVCILTTVHPPFDTRIFHKQAKTLVCGLRCDVNCSMVEG